jgi:hypothetical protein
LAATKLNQWVIDIFSFVPRAPASHYRKDTNAPLKSSPQVAKKLRAKILNLSGIFQGPYRTPPDALRFSPAQVARFQNLAFHLPGEGLHVNLQPGPAGIELSFMGK